MNKFYWKIDLDSDKTADDYLSTVLRNKRVHLRFRLEFEHICSEPDETLLTEKVYNTSVFQELVFEKKA